MAEIAYDIDIVSGKNRTAKSIPVVHSSISKIKTCYLVSLNALKHPFTDTESKNEEGCLFSLHQI